jgi:broad specificity phosphatase PhoE
MAAIYLIRHGQASFGQHNYDALSELGIRQSTLIGSGFKQRQIQFDLVVKGAMQRHAQTAEHCLQAMDYQGAIEIDPLFNEYPHEEVLYKYRPEFQDPIQLAQFLAQTPHPRQAFQALFRAAVMRWMSGLHDHEYSEPWAAFRDRVHQGIEQWLQREPSLKSIAVFTSGGPIALAVQYVLKLPDHTAIELSWSTLNGSVTKLLHQSDRISLSYFNDYSHLEQHHPDMVTYR